MKKLLVVGGASGIGLAIALEMASRAQTEKVYIVDKSPLPDCYSCQKIESLVFDLKSDDYSIFDRFDEIDSLMITAGFGKIALFKDVPEEHIKDSFLVNSVAAIRIIKRFYSKLEGDTDFYCGVMDSIAGWLSSPFLAVYGATKAALKVFIESINVELSKGGSHNVVLNVSPGFINGTSFYGKDTDPGLLKDLACEILDHLERKDDLFIPNYDKTYKAVLERYRDDFRKEGARSYDYKKGQSR